jgi:ABC-type enterochelin transport system permease subunit
MKFRTVSAIMANVKNRLEIGSRWVLRAWKACDCGAVEIFLFFVFAFVGTVLFLTGFYALEHTKDWVPPLILFVLATVFFVHALLTFAQIARRREP